MGNVVNVPGEGLVDFGDMTDDQVKEVLRKKFAPDPLAGSGAPPVDVSSMERPKDARGFKPIAEDVLTRMASSLSFGTAEKASAAINSLLGKGTYADELAKNRAATEAAGQRLGTAGTIASDIGGGVLSGSALARLGLTLMGRLPQGASLAQKVLAGTQEGFAYGAAQGAGHTDTGRVEDYVKNALSSGGWGALTGGGLTGLLGLAQKGITPYPITDPVRARNAALLDAEGVNQSAGQRVGDPKLRMAEDAAAKLVFGRDPAAGQMEQLTTAAARRAGIGGGGKITDEVLDNAFERVGGGIGDIQRRYAVNVDNDLLNTAARVESDMLPLAGESRQGTIQRFIDKLTGSQQLTPELAQATRTQLNQAIKGQNGPMGDADYQRALMELRDGLDDALIRTIQSNEARLRATGQPGRFGDAEALDVLRRQYANLHVLTDGLAHSGAEGLRGTLTPTALAAAVKRSVGTTGFMRGRGDLNELGRASADLIKPADSGTATREGLTNPYKWAMGAALRVPYGTNVGQRYLGNQVLPNRTPLPPPAVAGATGATAQPGQPGPIDRLWQGLLGGP